VPRARCSHVTLLDKNRKDMIHYRNVLSNGLNIFYREAGPADAPTVLLLHGYPTSSHMFRRLIPVLSAYYHVIAPDLPGFGLSDLPPREQYTYTFDNLAKTMQGFIDALGLKRFAIYVFDYGAPVGYRLAVANPEKITGIISQNGNAYDEGLSSGFAPLQKYWKDPSQVNRDALREFVSAGFTKWQYTEGVDDVSLIEPEAYVVDQHFLDRPGNTEIQLDIMLDYRENVKRYPVFSEYFRQHRPPLLAVWGDRDPFFLPAGAEAYKKDIPGAIVKFYPTGHFALETHLAEIGQEILSFLGSLRATGVGARPPFPPFNRESALQKVQMAEDAWNSKDPERVSLAYTVDTEWRNRSEFINGREEVKAFLKRKWEKELDYKLKKELWGFRENRMAVRFEYTWHDEAGQWYRSYGNELWEFDENGLMRKRYASINDVPIEGI
jgi:nuclear transport factor 2 (NTF2) superfamily protein/pimeloyl-ACP methyl ester carboxylesterase